MELIDGLSRLALSASSARYKECPVDFEVKTAVQEGKWCWWRPGHSGFPFQIYQALLSIWGGQLSPASLNASDWQDLAANGYQAILAADWLVQKELGRFGQVDEIERLAPRMMPCAWNYDSLYAFSSLGFEDSDTGKTHPCQYSAESEAEIAVIIMELRGSKEHQDLLESARNSEVSSTAALQNFYEFVRRNLGCKDRANPLSSCPEIHLLGMQGLAKLWNRESPLRGLERSFAKVEYDNPRPLQPFRLVVAIYANNRPHYLHQVLLLHCVVFLSTLGLKWSALRCKLDEITKIYCSYSLFGNFIFFTSKNDCIDAFVAFFAFESTQNVVLKYDYVLSDNRDRIQDCM